MIHHHLLAVTAYLGTGAIVFSLLWKYLWHPFVFNDPSAEIGCSFFVGVALWPAALAITMLATALVGTVYLLDKPVKSFFKWLNNIPKPNKKEISAE